MSKSEKCTYAATRTQKSCIVVKKISNQVQERAPKDQSVMLPHRPATMVKKPGQATQKKVLKNKNCSNVNMQPEKLSYSDEWLKKPVAKYKYKKHQEQVICQDKQSQETKKLCVRVKRAHLPSVVVGGQ